jgi:hypothetical protein
MELRDIARRLPEEIWTVFEPILPPVIGCGNGRPLRATAKACMACSTCWPAA